MMINWIGRLKFKLKAEIQKVGEVRENWYYAYALYNQDAKEITPPFYFVNDEIAKKCTENLRKENDLKLVKLGKINLCDEKKY